MKCLATFSENSLYKIKLAKTRKNVLESIYQRPSIVEVRPIKGESETSFTLHRSDKRSTGDV